MTNVTYQSVQQMIADGAETSDVERLLHDEHTPLTDKQVVELQRALNERDAE